MGLRACSGYMSGYNKRMPSDPPRDLHDVRMRGFTHRSTVEQAWSWLRQQVQPLPGEGALGSFRCAGRVLASDVKAATNVPTFDRSMMDGFAVIAADTLGAGPYSPLELTVIGQSFPGCPFQGKVTAGQAVKIMTGAPLPDGADAVLPAERTQLVGTSLRVLDELPPQKHVGLKGEDIAAGTVVLSAGRRLRPQDLGVLSSLGQGFSVVRQPRVRLIITGNELVVAGGIASAFQIRDANGPMLAALVERDSGRLDWGNEDDPFGGDCYLVRDDAAEILAAMQTGSPDVILISGGSSVGQEDHAPMLLAEHGELAIHGVAMRPSSPAGMGRLGKSLVFLLPGNPVSCLCAYDFFAGRAIRALAGLPWDWPYPCRRLPLRKKLVSVVGRVDYARVKINAGEVEPLAISGASILSSTTRADGFVVVPADSEGYPPGTAVDVFLYDVAAS